MNKIQRGLVPLRVETNQSGIAVEFERADFTAGRNEAQNRDDAQPQAPKPRLNRKTRAIRLNRCVKQNIQQGLIPIHIRGIRQRRARDVGEGAFIRAEGEIRRQRDACGNDLRIRKKRIAFVHFKKARNPHLRRTGEQSASALEIEIAGAALGKADVAHRLERHTHQQMKMPAFGLHKHLHGDVVGNVVGARKARQKEKRRAQEQRVNSKHAKHGCSLYLAT